MIEQGQSEDGVVVSLDSARARRAAALMRLRARFDVAARDVEGAWLQGSSLAGVELSSAVRPDELFVSVAGVDGGGRVLLSIARQLGAGYVALCHRLVKPGDLSDGLLALADGARHLVVRIDVPRASFSETDVATWFGIDASSVRMVELEVRAFERSLGMSRDGELAELSTSQLVVAERAGHSELPVESAGLDLSTLVMAHRLAVEETASLVPRLGVARVS